VLRWAGVADLAVAASIGADVPFCVIGGRARVRGIGEIVEPLPFTERAFTLLSPPLHVSTPAVYARWDELAGPADPGGVNDLQPAAVSLHPELLEWRDRLGNATGATPVLAGSGGTWFVEGAFPDAVPGVVVTRTARP
jgi:4-diphosphocytidyl-2-C-methyl-D-erythritol kinase